MNRLMKRALWSLLVLVVLVAALALLSVFTGDGSLNVIYDGF